ncbi:MAG: histidinol dehydrogenase, partial [Chloroflexota bacterium]|nr:histidinol dehydrogenase [Chloroflexota bacterium]
MRIVTDPAEARRLLTRHPGIEQVTGLAGGAAPQAAEAVERIVADVRERGDAAVREHTQRVDSVALDDLEVPASEWDTAAMRVPTDLADALAAAAERIRTFHQASMPASWRDEAMGWGERVVPLERVGIYVPGGNYASSVLMDAIPARVAGVGEVVVCSPSPTDAVLAAARIAGADRLFAIGGAQAIAAMAFGTESVPRVDKVCGAGNLYVTLAKRAVYGETDIDGLYGPTETLIIADESADPALAAADLLAQAEHDAMASPILIALSQGVAERVAVEVEAQVTSLERGAIAARAVEGQGIAAVVASIEEAVELANAYAPEHVCLLVEDAAGAASAIRNAGGVFVGESSPEVLGDYAAGPSHTMPTAASARFGSYLGVRHFLRFMPVVALDDDAVRRLGPTAAAIARAEGLTAHARAVERRLDGE